MTTVGIDTQRHARDCAIDGLGTSARAEFRQRPDRHATLAAGYPSSGKVGVEAARASGRRRRSSSCWVAVREVPPHLSIESEPIPASRQERSGDALRSPGSPSEPTAPVGSPVVLPTSRCSWKPVRTSWQMTRARNRLHAHLRILLPGYGASAANLVATAPAQLHALLRLEASRPELARAQSLGRPWDGERAFADRLARCSEPPATGLLVLRPVTGSSSQDGDVAVPIVRPFAALAGAAPIRDSGQTARMRLNRGEPQLNRACTRSPSPGLHYPPAIAYIARKRARARPARGHPCLKRQLVRTVFRCSRRPRPSKKRLTR